MFKQFVKRQGRLPIPNVVIRKILKENVLISLCSTGDFIDRQIDCYIGLV